MTRIYNFLLTMSMLIMTSLLLLSFPLLAQNNNNKNKGENNITQTDRAKQSLNIEQWRDVPVANTVLMQLAHGDVVLELAPQFSPKHVTQFINLVKANHYDGVEFYRVIDGFVAQAGPKEDSDADKSVTTLALEGEWQTNKTWAYTLVQKADLFAEQTGFKDGFAIAHNPSEQKAWLAHCPGIIAMARNNQAHSATSHFYITIGQAPRYLDRIMTIFGRVIYGMEHVQAIQRTAAIAGDKAVSPDKYTKIISMTMMNDLPPTQRMYFQVENTESNAFKEKLKKRLARKHAFFFKKPPQVLDICQTPVLTKKINQQAL